MSLVRITNPSKSNTLPFSPPRDLAPREHFVQFYHHDDALVNSVTTFIAAGLYRGEAAIVVATPAHRASFERELEAAGIDVAAAATRRRYFSLDAAETLDRFMVKGVPDTKKFMDVIGGMVAEVSANGTAVRAFGEMVAILWAEGNRRAALELEELWNELGRIRAFRLFCAYPASSFTGPNAGEPWIHVCKMHSRVLV